jgi:hypothetical protein
MGTLELPPALLKAVEGLRSAFLWDIKDRRASGARCLVAWDAVCRPKLEGGLGIKCLSDKNECLEMKLVHRLHTDRDAPWPRWVWGDAAGSLPVGHHWGALAKLMPLYRGISAVAVGDGRRTAFWLDTWVGSQPLCDRLPALFSHVVRRDDSVFSVLSGGLRRALVPRLTARGEQQLCELDDILGAFSLNPGEPDRRSLLRCRKNSGALDAAALYRLRTWGGVHAPFHDFVWLNHAPSKVQFFGWLLSRGRLQTRAALHEKNILTRVEAGCPISEAAPGSGSWVFIWCIFFLNALYKLNCNN